MTEHDDQLYLAHIAESIGRIDRSIRGDKDRFLSDVDIQDATLRRLQTLAEATQRLSAELKERHPEIPWSDISAFRNRMVHGYLNVNLDRAWAVVQNHLPPLALAVGQELTRGRDRPLDPGHDLGLGR